MAVSALKQKFETTARGSADAGTEKEPLHDGLKQADDPINLRQPHATPRRYLELIQDVSAFNTLV